MTTPRLESEDASERWSDLRLDAWVLCAEFVERIVAQARTGVANDPSGHTPDVNWASIWRAGDGAPSDEAAIGRIVRAASEAARGISLPSREAPSISTHRSNGAAVSRGFPWRALPKTARTPSSPWSRSRIRPNQAKFLSSRRNRCPTQSGTRLHPVRRVQIR